jgi:hypothetical protein
MIATLYTNTPWGKADSVDEIGEGIYSVSTPSHGGFFVPSALVAKMDPGKVAFSKRSSGSENWFEEDCAVAFVVEAFPHLFPGELERAREYIAAFYLDRQPPRL